MSSNFASAHDFTLSASEISFGTTNYYGHVGGSRAAALDSEILPRPGWKLTKRSPTELREHIAAGAMHDSAERCDAPKCHPETRVAVQDETIGWVLDGDVEEEPKNMLWVTGPAGGGKTAIMGSISDTCHKKGLLGCGFFFSSFVGSVDRRSKRCLVATMAYQLVQHEALRDVGERILSSVERNPAVFEQQLDVQLDQLLLLPFRESRRDPDALPWPKVIVIDGLDECDAVQYGDTARSPHVAPRTMEADQTEILHMLLKAANEPTFPFRFIIASRPEPALQSFFTDVAGYTTRKIFLDDKYNPDADMLLFLEAKFADIRRRYHLSHSWPSEDVKQTLVGNASGQFVYVATVMRFVGGSMALPQELLNQVLQLRISDASTNPFAPLDALYTYILNSSPNPPLTASWLHCIFCYILDVLPPSHAMSARFCQLFLESSPGEAFYVLGGLNSLISIPPSEDHNSPYSLFHKSLTDFLQDRSRCGDLYVNDLSELFYRRYVQIWKGKCVSLPIPPLTTQSQTRAQQHHLVHLKGPFFLTFSWPCRCSQCSNIL
jgi:hypothetical protein